MTDHLHRAQLALDEAERRAAQPDSGSLEPSMHFHRAQAHALVGILEHLTKPPPTSKHDH